MKTYGKLLACACVLALASIQTGCEVESTTENNVTVSPDSARLMEGQSATFTASGGFDYSWSLAAGKESWGTLSTRQGPTTTYTSRSIASNTTDNVQVLTLTSFIQGASTSGTNGQAYAKTVDIYITHLAPEPEPEPEPETPGAVSISPSAQVTLANGQTQSYAASGGDGTYAWTLSNAALGWLSTTTSGSTTYTGTYTDAGDGPKTQFLTVTSAGFNYTVSILQQ